MGIPGFPMFSPWFAHGHAQLPHHRSPPGDDAAGGGSPLLQVPVALGLSRVDIGVYDGADGAYGAYGAYWCLLVSRYVLELNLVLLVPLFNTFQSHIQYMFETPPSFCRVGMFPFNCFPIKKKRKPSGARDPVEVSLDSAPGASLGRSEDWNIFHSATYHYSNETTGNYRILYSLYQ